MAASDSEILEQLEALIADLSHIVSYKWLSRKFSVSSNAAKRLLHEFVDKHGAGVEVLYVLSGWTHETPPSYSVRLVKGSELEDAKGLLVEGYSSHVYSVQASLPGDPAQLWNHDFVQAEEFYNEPLEAVNCLRDNRFSGVSCSAVSRNTKARGSFHVPLPRLEQGTPTKLPDRNEKRPEEPGNPPPAPDEKNDAAAAAMKNPSSSRGANAGKAKPAHVVSLANMWGRSASNTSPPKVASISPKRPAVHGDSEAGQEDLEAGGSSDDELTNFVRLRRAGKKRRVVLDDEHSGDDDETERVDADGDEARSADVDVGRPVEQLPVPEVTEKTPGEPETKKKRKLIRTRIDERGREVTEVVWDGEGENKDETGSLKAHSPPARATEAPPKAEAPAKVEAPAKAEAPVKKTEAAPPPKQAAKPPVSKVASKPAAKGGKGGKPGPQQGSITSFFKKK